MMPEGIPYVMHRSRKRILTCSRTPSAFLLPKEAEDSPTELNRHDSFGLFDHVGENPPHTPLCPEHTLTENL